jgi:hypothetical protein
MIRGGERIADAAAAAGAQTLADAAVAPSSATSAPHPQLLPENPAYVSRTRIRFTHTHTFHAHTGASSCRVQDAKRAKCGAGGIYLSNNQLGPNGQNVPGKKS